jgi:hypothetical protein
VTRVPSLSRRGGMVANSAGTWVAGLVSRTVRVVDRKMSRFGYHRTAAGRWGALINEILVNGLGRSPPSALVWRNRRLPGKCRLIVQLLSLRVKRC